MKTYEAYQNLPPIAGLCTLEDAMKPGFSVEACVRRLKRFHYAFKRLHQIFTARITAEPMYELKMGFSYHAYLCVEHATALRRRISEMREPPLGLDDIPDSNLEVLFDEILSAPTTPELLLGTYECALPALKLSLEEHLARTNPLADQPSIRICRIALFEIADMIAFGRQAISVSGCATSRQTSIGWLDLLRDCLKAAEHNLNAERATNTACGRHFSSIAYQYDGRPKRDSRFPDPYNMGVNAEAFLYDDRYPSLPKVIMMFYKRLREIDVPEMMASIITETSGKPWDYYRDMTRQLWDEARHAMMGEVGFVSLGIDWPKHVMINFTWSLALNTQLAPLERHAVLYFIEQGLMPRNGTRFEWETGQASGNTLATLFQDYDWADEVLHARIGREWYLSAFDDPKKAVEYGDRCWSKVLMDWGKWQSEGLTNHRNWWPDAYQEACRHWKIEPDPDVLSYSISYEQVRADLKPVSGSS
jgi:hypothetical protein